MKQIKWIFSGWLALLAGNAIAAMNTEQKEQVQAIVWVVEGVSFVMIVAIFIFVWRISKRAKEDKKAKQEN